MNEPSVRSLGSLLSKVKWLVDARFIGMLDSAGIDITPEQWSVLIALHAHPGASQTELARRAFKDKSNVGRILDLLHRRGWVERAQHPGDRRTRRISLTVEGEAVTRAVFPIVSALNEQATAGLDPAEASLLLDLLERIKRDLEARTGGTNTGRTGE